MRSRKSSSPKKTSSPASAGQNRVELAPFLTMIGIIASIFIGVGVWFHSDIQEARQAASAAQLKAVQAEGELNDQRLRLDELRRDVEVWSTRIFAQTCAGLKGRPNPNFKTCDLPDGGLLRYEAPFP